MSFHVISEQSQPDSKCDMRCTSGKAATIGVVCQGQTGRWCEVLWICEDCVTKGEEAVPAQVAREWIAAGEMPNGTRLTGYADF